MGRRAEGLIPNPQAILDCGLNPRPRLVVALPVDVRPWERVCMLKFLGGTIGVIFLIGLLVVIGIFALIF
ncbi:MAG: hypothetical protein JWL93_539 [Hyphomicrobiales bacterium]|nr:hypothetical protein [Hyphomicrobiales bacterium]